MSGPFLRTAPVEWAWRAAAGSLHGLRWVDLTVDPEQPSYTRSPAGDTFRGPALDATLPPPMAEAAADASAREEPTALDGLVLLLARAAWTVETRALLWTSGTPMPEILARLVEAYGVDAEGHRHDPSLLVNLRAQLPSWYPHRGVPQRALDLLESALDEDLGVSIASQTGPSEAFVCHDARWWSLRGANPGTLVIEGDLTCFAPGTEPNAPVEDVRLTPHADVSGTPRVMFRLLPAWTTPRLLPQRDA